MILIIDNYDSFTYNLYQAIAQHGIEVQVVRNDKITLEEIEQLNPSGIILSPGPGRPEDAGLCIEIIRRFASKTPILGVCLGLQAIAVAYGGEVVQCSEIVHGKDTLVFHTRKGLYEALSLPFEAGRYHSLIVDIESLPKELVIEAENDSSIIMGLRHIDYPCFGVQFHPESILTPEGDQMLLQFVKLCKEVVQHA